MRRDSETYNKKDVSSEDRFRRSRSGSPNENGDSHRGRDSPKENNDYEFRNKHEGSGDAPALKQVDGNQDEHDDMDVDMKRESSEVRESTAF